MLDIVVTHYKEPWETGRKFFDMLGCQRGINFADIRVILVHDGTMPFEHEVFSRYPYNVTQYAIPHGGVSAARNCGLAHATDTWIQFCDFDDMYTHAYALKQILSVMDKDVDYMWTPFHAEYMLDGKLCVKDMDTENAVFIHGKYFRRQWLLDNRITFPVGISYSEDSAFCTIVNELAKPDRRGKITTKSPVYTWVYRPDSVSSDPENMQRNLCGFIERNFYVVEEFRRRGIPNRLMIGRMFMDAYHAFHQERRFPEEEQAFARRAGKYARELDEIGTQDMCKIFNAAGKIFRNKNMDYCETVGEWIARITGREAIAI